MRRISEKSEKQKAQRQIFNVSLNNIGQRLSFGTMKKRLKTISRQVRLCLSAKLPASGPSIWPRSVATSTNKPRAKSCSVKGSRTAVVFRISFFENGGSEGTCLHFLCAFTSDAIA